MRQPTSRYFLIQLKRSRTLAGREKSQHTPRTTTFNKPHLQFLQMTQMNKSGSLARWTWENLPPGLHGTLRSKSFTLHDPTQLIAYNFSLCTQYNRANEQLGQTGAGLTYDDLQNNSQTQNIVGELICAIDFFFLLTMC